MCLGVETTTGTFGSTGWKRLSQALIPDNIARWKFQGEGTDFRTSARRHHECN